MILCRLYRTMASFGLDSSRPVSRSVARHLSRCAACRQYTEAEAAVRTRLVREAERLRSVTPPFLASRILTALASVPATTESPRRPWARWSGSAALGTGVAVVVLLVLGRGPSPEPALPAPPAPAVSQVAASASASSGLPVAESWPRLGGWVEQPLEGELDAAVADARQAAVALAWNFLPESAAQNIAQMLGPQP